MTQSSTVHLNVNKKNPAEALHKDVNNHISIPSATTKKKKKNASLQEVISLVAVTVGGSVEAKSLVFGKKRRNPEVQSSLDGWMDGWSEREGHQGEMSCEI